MRFILFVLISIFSFELSAQNTTTVSGTINDDKDNSVDGVHVRIINTSIGTFSDKEGNFNLIVPPSTILKLLFTHISYDSTEFELSLNPGDKRNLKITLIQRTKLLDEVDVVGVQEEDLRSQVSVYTLEPRSVKTLPSAFNDFSSILFTLPGVVGNNELSSTYSVRGGNFDENLVYVNDIPIYRPQLISSGQQEGLSFVNPDMVENVSFSAGGWQPKYGDKLSSSLNITYRNPQTFRATGTIGLLGAAIAISGRTPNQIGFNIGIRHKNSKYLLNTFDTEGAYLPKFTDVQSYFLFPLNSSTEIGVLFGYARNRYLVEPENRETEFGAFGAGALRLFVAFNGQEVSQYDTYQGGIKISKKVNNRFKSDLIISGVYSMEREFSDLEGGYRLCDLDNDPASSSFNQCVSTLGLGTNFNYARNMLDVRLLNAENRNILNISSRQTAEFGIGYSRQLTDDQLNEYEFIDSADFVTITDVAQSESDLNSNHYSGYYQHVFDLNRSTLVAGFRFNYWDLNMKWIFSPRLQYAYQLPWIRDAIFKASLGLYQQHPFFREMRDFSGSLHTDLKPQSSIHFITGLDYNFKFWGRDFKLLMEAYYKYLYDVIPYDVDNVRIRYYASNNTKAYAVGFDTRISGEFIPGTESWFSISILSTKEDVENDGNGYIRRPTDQRLNLGIVFQDHIPNDPSLRVNLGLLYGTGFPFGPPNSLENRNIFSGDDYTRVDIGISKHIDFEAKGSKVFKSLLIGVEILNLLGARNSISYLWVEDVSGRQFAVPNNLSARFFNFKIILDI